MFISTVQVIVDALFAVLVLWEKDVSHLKVTVGTLGVGEGAFFIVDGDSVSGVAGPKVVPHVVVWPFDGGAALGAVHVFMDCWPVTVVLLSLV